jgi:dihydropteroate synthase
VVDPGIGFGKTLEHNLEILRRLREFRNLGCAVLVGTSRKSMIGKILDLPADQRVEGTAATVALAIAAGADIVRVHDVKEMTRVVRVADAIVRVRHEAPESEHHWEGTAEPQRHEGTKGNG